MDRNPYLSPDDMSQVDVQTGRGYIETPGDTFYNMVWQTRSVEPDEYQIQLCNALESIFDQGKYDLQQIVKALQQSTVKLPDGKQWTEETFIAEMHRLDK